MIRVGSLVLDLDKRAVNAGGAPIHLTPMEYRLLVFLAQNKGRPVTRDEIMDELYRGVAEEQEPHSKIIHVFVCKLRRRLGNAVQIRTAHRRGYILSEAALSL